MFGPKQMTDTVQLQDTIVQLDALRDSYDKVLKQAVAQLETLTLSEEDAAKIAAAIFETGSRFTRLSESVTAKVYQQMMEEEIPEDQPLNRMPALYRTMINQACGTIADSISEMVTEYITTAIASDATQKLIRETVEKQESIYKGSLAKISIRHLVESAFDEDEVTALLADRNAINSGAAE